MKNGEAKFVELVNRLITSDEAEIEAEGRENFCEHLRNALAELQRSKISGRFRMITELSIKLQHVKHPHEDILL
jgi:ABC-type proline/glycine betaine transport system ATPase subunit